MKGLADAIGSLVLQAGAVRKLLNDETIPLAGAEEKIERQSGIYMPATETTNNQNLQMARGELGRLAQFPGEMMRTVDGDSQSLLDVVAALGAQQLAVQDVAANHTGMTDMYEGEQLGVEVVATAIRDGAAQL